MALLSRKILVVETGEVYNTQSGAAKRFKVSQPMINKTLKSNGKWAVRGFHLRYVDGE